LPTTFIVSATAENLMKLFYPHSFVTGATALSVLIFAVALLAVNRALCAAIVAGGRPGVATTIGTVILVIDVVLSIYLVGRYGIWGAAVAACVASLIGVSASLAYVCPRFGAPINALSLLRVAAPCLVVYCVARVYAPSGLPLVGYCIGLFALYILLLLAIGEIKRSEIARILDALRFQQAPAS